jgi:putative flippase GtrA
MRSSNVEFGGAAVGEVPCHGDSDHDPVRRFFAVLPRPLRFLGVGGLGLITDLAVFTLIIAHSPHPLLARLVSLAIATLVTWRLNRALTFDRSGRRSADEALRYAAVAASAQAISYGVFAVLVVTALAALPQLAVIVGAACGALVSYSGQALFAFRPHKPAAARQNPT